MFTVTDKPDSHITAFQCVLENLSTLNLKDLELILPLFKSKYNNTVHHAVEL